MIPAMNLHLYFAKYLFNVQRFFNRKTKLKENEIVKQIKYRLGGFIASTFGFKYRPAITLTFQ